MYQFLFFLRVSFILNLLFVLCIIQQWYPLLNNGDLLSLMLIAGWLMPIFVNGITIVYWVFFIRSLKGLSLGLRTIFFVNLFFFLFQILFFSL